MRHRPPRDLSLRITACVGAMLVAGGLLAACTPTPTTETPSPTPTVTSTVTATPTPAAPVFHSDGTAEDNLPIFRAIVEKVWASDEKVHGRAYVDALVAAGFDKKSMQVTEDESTVGNPAETIQFSVHWTDGQCLIGQVGPQTGDPVAAVVPGLADGKCLLGKTRDIDW